MITNINIRKIEFKLHTYNRSLELCARMNYEVENLDFIDSIEPGSNFYDLGACEGRFSIYAALKGLNVFSFEPNKKNYKVLIENIKINNLEDKIKVFNVGLGEKNHKGILQIGQPWEGGHQKVIKNDFVREDLNFDFVENEEVDIVSIDSFVEKMNLPKPNALKIDIDGSEVSFLMGAKNTLKCTELSKIIFELDKDDKHYDRIVEQLSQNNFLLKKYFTVPNEKSLFNIIFEK